MTWDDLPWGLQQVMLHRQEEAGNKRDPEVFKNYLFATSTCGGFDWDNTPEELDFWSSILDEGLVSTYYDEYNALDDKSYYYHCVINAFPEHLKYLAIKRYTEQYGEDACKEEIILKDINEAFCWNGTSEGREFWASIYNGDLSVFYRLPKGDPDVKEKKSEVSTMKTETSPLYNILLPEHKNITLSIKEPEKLYNILK